MSTVVHISIAPERGAPMQAVAEVEALARSGLRGDRYVRAENRRSPDYDITLIEAECIKPFVRETGLALGLEEPRRNLVTRCDPVSDGAA